jgi:DNA-binding response OmpR family regulator
MRILVVEDDANIADVLQRGLVEQHYSVDVACDGEEGEDMAWSNEYDLLIVDVRMPKKDGLALCKSLRAEGLATPILMLTALASPGDTITGLDHGADDYLTKPFDFGVLLARVRSLTRRRSEHRTAELRAGGLAIDTTNRTVTRGGELIRLTGKEFSLLEYLVLNRGKVLSREMIGEHVWDIHFDPRSNVVDSLVRCVRVKVDRGSPTSYIETVRGFGYRLIVPDSEGGDTSEQ